ncbi:pyridoxal phosphate-dependent aminotransferase [Thermodesulfobacteriota bacterium]
MKISEKARSIPPFLVMEVMERAQALESRGTDVVHMEVGEPDFDTPGAVIEAAMDALGEGKTHYTHSMGRIELREGIAGYYRERYGIDVSPERIIVTSGSSPALLLVFMAICDPGDEIILTNPHYACYPPLIAFGQGRPVFVDVFEADGFQYRPESIRDAITPATRAILVNSPSNPTGNLLSDESMRAIAGLSVPVVSDEIYHGLVYEGRAHSILEFTDDAIVINGFSKLFAMTGWRLGYAIVPEALVRPIQKMQQNFFISAGDFAQSAALAALTECGEELEAMRREYDRRRKLVLSRLRDLGLGVAVEPVGAFYVFCNMKSICEKTGMDSYRLAFDILERAHLAVTPGTDFGPGGEGYIRLSYATDYERIEEGMNRLEGFLKNIAS